jgi:MFS family permease
VNNSTEQVRAAPAKLGLALAALACAQLVTALDFNIVYVALPEIGLRLGFSPQSQQWVFSAYSMMFGGFLLLGGRAAGLFGRRRMLILGLTLYAASSLLGGLAGSSSAMIAARAIQGIGGAILFPATVSLINTLFKEGPERNRALGLWSLAGSSGLTLGSIVGGLLVGTLGWPSVFFVNVPIAILVGLGALIAIPRDPPSSDKTDLGLPGAVTSTVGVTLLVLTLVQAPEWGGTSAWTLMGAVTAVVLLGVFVLIEARTVHPAMPLDLLGRGSLAPAMT